MNRWTRLLALGLLTVGAIGQGSAIAALNPSTSTSVQVRDRDSFKIAQRPIEDKQPKCVTIASDNTIIYSRPSTNSTAQLLIDRDDIVRYEELNNPLERGWVKIESAIGQEWSGYVELRAIGRPVNCPASTQSLDIPENAQCYIVGPEVIGMRMGRNADLPIVGELSRGEQIFLLNNMRTDSDGRVWAQRANTGDVDIWLEFKAPRSDVANFSRLDNFNCASASSD